VACSSRAFARFFYYRVDRVARERWYSSVALDFLRYELRYF
jgi:hypothetical protein